jgi:hypothetical protein
MINPGHDHHASGAAVTDKPELITQRSNREDHYLPYSVVRGSSRRSRLKRDQLVNHAVLVRPLDLRHVLHLASGDPHLGAVTYRAAAREEHIS